LGVSLACSFAVAEHPVTSAFLSRDFGEFPMCNFIEATRELCDDLESLVEIAKQSRAPIRALSLIERARADLQAYLDEIDPAFPGQIKT
jgi:hypothetical protein